MTTDTNNASINSFLAAVRNLKRHSAAAQLSPVEKAARISSLIDRLSAIQRGPITLPALPITRSAEER
jgi:hypothetical protein